MVLVLLHLLSLLTTEPLPPNGGFTSLCSLHLHTLFTVNNGRRYFVAYVDETDGVESYGNAYDTREEAQAFCDCLPGCYVVYRRPLDFSPRAQRV